jgi:transcriptional regulator with XRE-family HTH domain
VRKRKVIALDVYVAWRMRFRRSEIGLKQADIARFIGVTTQQVQKYEAALDRISAGHLFMIAMILEVPVGYFFEGVSQALKHPLPVNRRRRS